MLFSNNFVKEQKFIMFKMNSCIEKVRHDGFGGSMSKQKKPLARRIFSSGVLWIWDLFYCDGELEGFPSVRNCNHDCAAFFCFDDNFICGMNAQVYSMYNFDDIFV